jgi:putative peptidoglycan lipid II flippase
MLLNVIWIVAVLGVVPRSGPGLEEKIVVVAWAVLLAGVVQLAFQIPVLIQLGFRPALASPRGDPRVARVLALMGPAALGLAVTQVNVVVDKLLAVWVGPWAPAALFFSERLVYFPLGIFATALGTVLLPAMSGHAASGEENKISAAINHGLRNLLFIMTPAAVGLLVLAGPVVKMIFEWRTFDSVSTTQTMLALQFYAPGLVMFSLSKVFVPAFYARQDTRTPVKVGVISVGLNLVLNIVFVMTWPGPIKHAGLAFATVLAAGFNAAVLAGILHRRYGNPGWREIAGSAVRSLAAAALMGLAAVSAHAGLLRFLSAGPGSEKWVQVGSVMGAIGAGAIAYFLLAALFRAPELKEIRGSLKRRATR